MAEQDTLNRIAYSGRQLPANLDALLYLGVEHDDMFDNIKMHRVNAVIDFFQGYKDGMAVLRRVAIKAPRDKRIDTLWEYMHMRKTHDAEAAGVAEDETKLQERRAALSSLKRDIESFE